MDLADLSGRTALAARLASVFRGRRVVLGPRVLAGARLEVELLTRAGAAGCLVVASVRGAGSVPDPAAAEVVWLPSREFASVSEELRAEDARVRTAPPEVVRAVEDFDPDREALWMGTPFVTSDEPVLGRRVVGGRPAAWLALEDKIAAEEVWEAAEVDHAPSLVVRAEADALDTASAALDRGQGVVWAGDNRGGFHGGGNLVRWVTDTAERRAALEFLGSRCDRVRVQPFLDGVPCSIHGCVVDDGTAAFRPVEIAMLRRGHELVYGGLSTHWDPPAADREQMRSVARRVGEHLRRRHHYRGFFGVDGVLTADGFRPTELNPRISAGVLTQFSGLEPSSLVLLVQLAATSTPPQAMRVAELESVLPAIDTHRVGRLAALWEGPVDPDVMGSDDEQTYHLRYDGSRFVEAAEGDSFSVARTSIGLFGWVRECSALAPGERLAPLNTALMAFLDDRYGTRFGEVAPAPDLRP